MSNLKIKKFALLGNILFLLGAIMLPLRSYANKLEQQTFTTPSAAVAALIAANRDNNPDAILKILGAEGKNLIFSGDPAADELGRKKFVAAYDVYHKLEISGSNKEILIVGKNEWPLPIPLIRQNDKWLFDTAAGAQEILDRRVGRNELNVIRVCHAYVEAQREYANMHPLKNGKHLYAQSFTSHKGMQDGLYWPVNVGEKESPLGPLLAEAEIQNGVSTTGLLKHEPYHGYYYKILTRQSKNAPGGAINYISQNQMTGGFALVAYPAKYGDSGIMTFMVNQDGVVYQRDFGPQTATIAAKITEYDLNNTCERATM